MRKMIISCLLLSLVVSITNAGDILSHLCGSAQGQQVEFIGDILFDEDISAVAVLNEKYLLLASDEGRSIQVLKKLSSTRYEVYKTIPIGQQTGKEYDFESIAVQGSTVYISGSYGRKRKRVKESKTYQENIERLVAIDPNEATWVSFKLEFDMETGEVLSQEEFSLRDLFEREKILLPFMSIPAKENGLDVEGIAFKENHVYLGLRSPLIRGPENNYALVLNVSTENNFTKNLSEQEHSLMFVDLFGAGVRDIQAVEDGFLILSGPANQSTKGYCLWFWNGKDMLASSDYKGGEVTKLGDVTHPGLGKGEGMTVLEETEDIYRILIVYDGVSKGDPVVFEIKKRVSIEDTL